MLSRTYVREHFGMANLERIRSAPRKPFFSQKRQRPNEFLTIDVTKQRIL
jgi:hypothetical protein